MRDSRSKAGFASDDEPTVAFGFLTTMPFSKRFRYGRRPLPRSQTATRHTVGVSTVVVRRVVMYEEADTVSVTSTHAMRASKRDATRKVRVGTADPKFVR